MFASFTDQARNVVVFAQEEARALHHNYIGTEHLLLGILRERAGVGRRALDRLGVRLEDVRTDVLTIVGAGEVGSLDERDSDALRTIGIDLGEVRRRMEDAFGPGALEHRVRVARRRQRRRGCGGNSRRDWISGSIPFTPRAKKVLELALAESKRQPHPYVETEHILLGLVREGHGVAVNILDRRSASAQQVRRVVLDVRSAH